VVAAVTRTNIALMQDALGLDASAVSFMTTTGGTSGRRPPWPVGSGLLGDATDRGHPRVRLIREDGFGTPHDGEDPHEPRQGDR